MMPPRPSARRARSAAPGSRPRLGRATVAAATAALATAAGLGLAELAARRATANTRARIYRFSDERIYVPAPGAHKVYTRRRVGRGTLQIPMRFNRLGLRGPDPDPADSRPRVVVFGDSFVEARYVPEEETFAVRLEGSLTSLGRLAQVWNAGIAGYGPDQSFLRLDAELGELAPDLVVFVVYAGNDFGDLLRNKLFRVGDNGIERVHPVYGEVLRRSFAPRPGSALLDLVRSRFAREPRTSAAPRPIGGDRLESILDGALGAARDEHAELARGDLEVRYPFRDLYDADLSLEPGSPSARAKAELMRAILAAVVERARSGDVELLFVFVPHLLDTCPPLGEGELGRGGVDRKRWPDYVPSGKTDLLRSIAEEHGAPYLDLWPVFREHCAEQLYYTGVDDHWTARGQALAAEHCARRIDVGELLP